MTAIETAVKPLKQKAIDAATERAKSIIANVAVNA